MPRQLRYLPLGTPVHIVSRGNDRREVFADSSDFLHFLQTLGRAAYLFPVDIDAYCCLTNHVHLVLRQYEPDAIPAYMHRVLSLSAMRYREGTGTLGLGHVFQRRYWSHAISTEVHYLSTLRYVEANAQRAGLVRHAEDWKWGSLWERVTGRRGLLARPLVTLPKDWRYLVNRAMPPRELEALRQVARRRPVRRGDGAWRGPAPHGGRPSSEPTA